MDGKTVKVPLTFRIFRGDDLVRTETLTQSPIKIGKLSSSHLRIEEDESVSRMHAVIEVVGPNEITIIDLGSTKGTIVNGKKVNKASLQDGDIILLGDTKIVLSVGDVEEETSEDEKTQVTAAPTVTAPAPPARPAPAPPVLPPPPLVPPTAAAPTVRMPPTPAAPPASPASTFAPPSPPPAFPVGAQPVASMGFGADASPDVTGSRAIEVAAMLSDSVVAVKHLTNPTTGKVSGSTIALFVAGGVLLASSLGLFIKGVSVSAENERRHHQFVEVERQPEIAFRPIRLNPVLDFAVVAGLLGGMLCVGWAGARVLDERRSPFFRVGRSREVEFPTDVVPGGGDSFALVQPQGNEFVFSWSEPMKGDVTLDGKVTPLDQVPRTGPIPPRARIRVELGQNTFFVSSVPAPRAPAGGFTIDGAVILFTAISAALHGALLLFIYLVPGASSGYFSEDENSENRYTRAQIKAQEEPKQEDKPQNVDKGIMSGGTGERMKLEEGKMGKEDSTRKAGQYQIEKVEGVDPQLAKEKRLERARTAGILGVLRAQQGGTFASITATGDFSAGLDDRDIQGGLLGNEPGEMAGGWGYGVSGTGAGGGGTGSGTIGTGRYGTIGHGSGTGTGYGIGGGAGGMRGRVAKVPNVTIGNATATGDLDKNTIRRYVRQKLPLITYCYEKQLVTKPSLAGTVVTAFTIDGNGRVISVRAGGMGNADVENCVADILKSIQFPKPTGGGIVNVTSYPFSFRASGG
jgi:pSer/pThr/pTyr-binding forkhead associated (FHA) protein